MKFKIILLVALVVSVIGGVACRHAATSTAPSKLLYYACPMHPTVKYDKPGACPICGMNLEPVYTDNAYKSAGPCGAAGCAAPGATNKP